MRADMTHLCTEKGAREAEEQESIYVANERNRIIRELFKERDTHKRGTQCWYAVSDCIHRVQSLEVKEVDGD